MCESVMYCEENKIVKVYFAHPKAKLAVKCLAGEIDYVTWGRRHLEPGALPVGGWANHRSLRLGKWDKFFPINVKVLATEFMVKELATGLTNWYSLNPTQFIHGIIARSDQEKRLYIVTLQAEQGPFIGAWPRILNDRISSTHNS